MNLPGGGSVLIPEPYDRKPSYPTYSEKHGVNNDAVIAYRNWRSTMSGHPECNGMIAVANADRFESLRDFMRAARGALSIPWSAADIVAGTGWTANEQKYPIEERAGEKGPEIVQLLAVHRSGFFDVYDDPALMYLAGRGAINIGVWITNRQGGPKRALQLVDRIAASLER